MKKNKIIIVVHSGSFHADDVFAVATLELVLEKDFTVEVVRTRDPNIIRGADYVVDVGEVYDPESKRFDHHQYGGAGVRDDGVPYASFGLVWKEYGQQLCGDTFVAGEIEQKLVKPIDAMDNGITLSDVKKSDMVMYDLKDVVSVFRTTWKEEDTSMDRNFAYLTSFAKEIIKREIVTLKDTKESDIELSRAMAQQKGKTLLIIDKPYNYELLVSSNDYIFLVVHPKRQDGTWAVKTVRDDIRSYEDRIKLPLEWAGKSGEDLQKITGVEDAIFCHRGRFIAVASSKEGAIKLAHIALEKAGKSIDR